jgi:1-acyl-sn-glycerol-3-phosphate acyltransferase
MGVIRFFISVLLTLMAAIACLPTVLFFPARGTCAVGRIWSWLVLKVCNVRVQTHGLDGLDSSRGYLVLSNHTSFMDAVVLYRVMPFPFRVVAKRELTFIPVFGQVLWLGAAIIVDRGNRAKAIKSVQRARRAIEKGQSILIFPEGTRTPEGEIGSLKKGAFYMATEAEVPILPIGIQGSGPCLPRGSISVRPGTINFSAGKPIGVEGYPANPEGRKALLEEVEARLRELVA